MSLVGKINGWILRTVAGDCEAEEIGHGAAAHEQTARSRGKTADLTQPVDSLELDSRCGGDADPSAGKYVVSGNDRIGERADVVARPRNVGEEARMVHMHGVVEHALLQVDEEMVEACALLGRRSADICEQF